METHLCLITATIQVQDEESEAANDCSILIGTALWSYPFQKFHNPGLNCAVFSENLYDKSTMMYQINILLSSIIENLGRKQTVLRSSEGLCVSKIEEFPSSF